MRIAIVGNPNSGKSTLFNALTGATQRVGNWPGVTVECATGQLLGTDIELIDLPGIYSLICLDPESAQDSQCANHFLRESAIDLIINIIDASNIERNLFLTSQLQDLGIPMLIALNMVDVAKQRRNHIDTNSLARELGAPVVAISANRQSSLITLKTRITEYCQALPQAPSKTAAWQRYLPKSIHAALAEYTISALEGDCNGEPVPKSALKALEQSAGEEPDIIIADARYAFAHAITKCVLTRDNQQAQITSSKIDKWVLNRFLGIPIFLGLMYTMFLFALSIGGLFQDFVDLGSETLFVHALAQALSAMHAPMWLIGLLADGVGKGINTTLTFVPVIAAMFFFLATLESSGYMARAAFVMDKLMSTLGLPGKSFVPMIIGFGCNVPGVMAARTLDSKRDRILTIIMQPFMSCSARLAIFAVFASAFFPQGGHNIVFALYLIGILMAVLTGFILRKTLLPGKPSPLIMELPAYHMPTLLALAKQTWLRTKRFLTRAITVIVPICTVLGLLHSMALLPTVGRMLTPLFTPMGVTVDNWPATVGLVTGMVAKEVVIATLNTLYGSAVVVKQQLVEQVNILDNLKEALATIPANIQALPATFKNPILASAPQSSLHASSFGAMYQAFGSPVAAFAYLLFVLLYVPCVSTMAVIKKELNRAWMWFSILWSVGLAYAVAVVFYQIATMPAHMLTSLIWLFGISGLFAFTILKLKQHTQAEPL